MTSDQTMNVCNAMVARCKAGNSWPPDLAEFVTLVAESGTSRLGLKVADVMAEYRRWRNESYRYASTEEYFIERECHPVMYQICTEMKRTGIERQMTENELERLAGQQLMKWEKHLNDGYPIPPVRKQINRPRHPSGPTPAQLLKAQAEVARLKKFSQGDD
ncbi:replication protein P [Enterobacter kobei]|uniref:replication protein P n=2 Tax=Enterobacter TaxID=547 RepID=UPI002FD25C9F